MFPWTGLAVAGLLGFQPTATKPRAARRSARVPRARFGITFFLFSASLTKFHHYILPAVPPLAMLTGIAVERAFPEAAPRGRTLATYFGAIGFSALLLVYGVLRLMPGSVLGDVPPPAASLALGVGCLVAAALAFAFAARLWPV